MKILCISGKARHGKDTTALFIKELIESRNEKKKKTVLIAHYGDLLKYMCTTFFNWDGKKDYEGRSLLQYVATDIVRRQNPDFWVNFISSTLTLFDNYWDYVILADTRFPNEINVLKDAGFDVTTIRVIRDNFDNGLTYEQKIHPSETSLDKFSFDFILHNDSSLNELKNKIQDMLGVI